MGMAPPPGTGCQAWAHDYRSALGTKTIAPEGGRSENAALTISVLMSCELDFSYLLASQTLHVAAPPASSVCAHCWEHGRVFPAEQDTRLLSSPCSSSRQHISVQQCQEPVRVIPE